MGRRSEHSRDELRGLIMQAVKDLVRGQGEASLTARNIAKSIGYTPGMLYHIFPNQDAMVQALAEELLSGLLSRLQQSAQSLQAGEAMLSISREYIAFAIEEPALWRLIWNHPYGQSERSAQHQDIVREILNLASQALRERHPGRDSPWLHNAVLAWLAGLQGVAMLGITERLQLLPDSTVESVAESLTRQFME